MTLKTNKSKLFNSFVFLLFTIFTSSVLLELALRIIPPISTGNNSGIGKAWVAEYWQPINQQGYRDFDVKLSPKKKLIVSIGDSFTAGHGVVFEDTYTFELREKFAATHDVVNLGDSGSSTPQQKQNYLRFVNKFKKVPDVVLYQYFGNDIENYAHVEKCERYRTTQQPLIKFLSKISYSFELFRTLFLQRQFSSCYLDELFAAYQSPLGVERHKDQIADFVKLMQSKKTQVIVLVFPFLANDDLVFKSKGLYINELLSQFRELCEKHDRFYDASAAAATLSAKRRVANFLDAHPSAHLHHLVAVDIEKMIRNTRNVPQVKGFHQCK